MLFLCLLTYANKLLPPVPLCQQIMLLNHGPHKTEKGICHGPLCPLFQNITLHSVHLQVQLSVRVYYIIYCFHSFIVFLHFKGRIHCWGFFNFLFSYHYCSDASCKCWRKHAIWNNKHCLTSHFHFSGRKNHFASWFVRKDLF